jgi:beta-galactosidase
VGRDFELAFDQASGGLRRGVGFGQALLLEAPRIHLLPAATPLSPLPNPLSWRLRALEIKPEGDNVRVAIQGSYERFEGGYNLLVTPAGEMTVQSVFKYTGDKLLAREIGLAFFVPTDCDLLRWERRGEWSVYPGDHIGRPLGETRAVALHADTLPPTWSWAADNSPMGCNDFRSTKRHLDWASISYPDGPGVWVDSGGSRHVRALVASDRIMVHVNDWYGGTHVGLGEWTRNYGEGQWINPGQTLESTLRLRLARIQPAEPTRTE